MACQICGLSHQNDALIVPLTANIDCAAVPRSAAMKLAGHKTEAVAPFKYSLYFSSFSNAREWRNGRRAGLRIQCRKAWGFKSPLSHSAQSYTQRRAHLSGACRSATALPQGELMQTRVVQMGGAIAAVVLAVMVARTEAFAHSDKESCSETSTDVTSGPNADGTEATCDAATGAPNKATAHASGEDATAYSEAEDNSEAVSSASGEDAGAGASSVSGKTKATAKGSQSEASSEIDETGGGKATSTATDGGEAIAEIPNGGGGDAVAKGKDAGAQATSDVVGGGGKATSDSSGNGSDAIGVAKDGGAAKATAREGAIDVEADALASGCKATATGSGTGSESGAVCENAGSVVTATATKGSIAEGSDTAQPTCTPKNGGEAKVTSPMGNCG
jgi:hypothetical protein